MGVVDALKRIRSPIPAEVGRIVALLGDEPAAGLVALQRFVETIDDHAASADARLAALEALRPAWIAAVPATLQSLYNQPIPYRPDELARFQRARVVLAALRDAGRRLHADLREPQPQAPPTPRALLALARALDAQSRLLSLACRLRIALPRDEWDELCRLAHPFVAASALDERYPEAAASDGARRATPRVAFAMPLLLRLVEPLGLSTAALEVAHALARRAARGCGVAIELDGLPHVGRDGPALMLSAHHTVTLDTRAVRGWIANARERLAAGEAAAAVGLHTTMPVAALDRALEQLAGVWAVGYVPTPLVRPPLAHALLHAGLPRRPRGGGVAVLRDGEIPAAVDPGADATTYEYGRTTALRALLGPIDRPPGSGSPDGRERFEEAAGAMLTALGEAVEWRGQDARRSVFARSVADPRLRLGQLVAVLPVRSVEHRSRRAAARPGSGPSRVLLGRVVTLSHTGAADGREPYAHDVGVAFWPGTPVPVRVRAHETNAFEDAWWFPVPTAGEPSSLVLRVGRFTEPFDVLMRDPVAERELRVRRLIERGRDFDRVEVAPIG